PYGDEIGERAADVDPQTRALRHSADCSAADGPSTCARPKPSNRGATVDSEMLKTWVSRGATIAPAGFAIFTWYQRQADAREHERREALQTVAIALRDVCRDAFAIRYRGPNTLEISQKHLGVVVKA